jgi:hypothetical protein
VSTERGCALRYRGCKITLGGSVRQRLCVLSGCI